MGRNAADRSGTLAPAARSFSRVFSLWSVCLADVQSPDLGGAIEANTGKPLVWCGALPVGGEGKDLGS